MSTFSFKYIWKPLERYRLEDFLSRPKLWFDFYVKALLNPERHWCETLRYSGNLAIPIIASLILLILFWAPTQFANGAVQLFQMVVLSFGLLVMLAAILRMGLNRWTLTKGQFAHYFRFLVWLLLFWVPTYLLVFFLHRVLEADPALRVVPTALYYAWWFYPVYVYIVVFKPLRWLSISIVVFQLFLPALITYMGGSGSATFSTYAVEPNDIAPSARAVPVRAAAPRAVTAKAKSKSAVQSRKAARQVASSKDRQSATRSR